MDLLSLPQVFHYQKSITHRASQELVIFFIQVLFLQIDIPLSHRNASLRMKGYSIGNLGIEFSNYLQNLYLLLVN